MRSHYFCEVQICLKSNANDIIFQRICRSKKDAEALGNWIHSEYINAGPSGILSLEMPCRRNQAPRTVSLRTEEIAAITTVVDRWDEEEEFTQKFETGFHIAADEAPDQIITEDGSERETAARAKVPAR